MGTGTGFEGEWVVNITPENRHRVDELVDDGLMADLSKEDWIEAALGDGKLVIRSRMDSSHSLRDGKNILTELAQWSEPGSYLIFTFELGSGWLPEMYWVDEGHKVLFSHCVQTFPVYDEWKAGFEKEG